MEEDLRCYTLHYFYKVIDTDLFNGEDGFLEFKAHKATKIPSLEEDIKRGEAIRKDFAKLLKVSVEKIKRIDRDEYLENVPDDEEEE
ncbi:hypothetical protein NSA23_15555 [Anaerosalibacter massiliensis]|uniref:Uncharacterized protein n=1 Tax=Anaerosalibacter massiliensis TaxID=1347392 RepID=A0A9X2MI00_9FIRM|nr:hypothetical protein [Anaerosalibacter massiliensis]MCR2045517.1 hypothetical protein [Anaerosalibacter massiliensis]